MKTIISSRISRNDELDQFVLAALQSRPDEALTRNSLSHMKSEMGVGKNLFYDELDSSLLRLIVRGLIGGRRDSRGVMIFFAL